MARGGKGLGILKMAGVKGRSGTNKGKDKPFAEALRMEIAEAGTDHKRLRGIARKLLEKAEEGDLQAIQQVADRLDGKPVQESEVTVHRDVTELTDAEIAARIAELRGAIASDGDASPPLDPQKLN